MSKKQNVKEMKAALKKLIIADMKQYHAMEEFKELMGHDHDVSDCVLCMQYDIGMSEDDWDETLENAMSSLGYCHICGSNTLCGCDDEEEI